ncbi:chemotaxis protein CheD [Pseudomonas sp. NPDC089734]|uniref:chemotaxis protein CheD n=1 Tax=Pseudomonas sp. NPDC089734 TaxID=3364469 RepID=UPI00381B2573
MNPPLFLRPGDYFFGRYDGPVTTLLGSCVSIILWHPRWHLLAVSHYVLPHDPAAGQGLDPLNDQDTRYGDAVFERMQADMRRHGTNPSEYRKGIFGGGCLSRFEGNPKRKIGHTNSDFARRQFSLRHWSVDLCDLNGTHYRRLQIDGASGRIDCQRNQVTLPTLAVPRKGRHIL